MKEPRKGMSSSEFSFLVVRLCLMLGCISLIVVLLTSGKELTWAFDIPIIILMFLVALICLLSLIIDFRFRKRKDDDEK